MSDADASPIGLLDALMQLNKQLLGLVILGVLVASIFVGVVTLVFLAPTKSNNPWGYGLLAFAAGFFVNLAAASAIYLVSLKWIIPKIKQLEARRSAEKLVVDPLSNKIDDVLKELSAKIDKIKISDVKEYISQFQLTDFDQDITHANHIDVCVQGWDGMVKHHKQAWEQFLSRNGEVNLILPKVIQDGRNTDPMPHIQYRLGNRTRAKQTDEINDTYKALSGISSGEVCRGRGTIRRWDYEPMIWYCLILIDMSVAYISCYEHVVADGAIQAPFLRINLERFPSMKKWMRKEVTDMIKAVQRLQEAHPQTPASVA